MSTVKRVTKGGGNSMIITMILVVEGVIKLAQEDVGRRERRVLLRFKG